MALSSTVVHTPTWQSRSSQTEIYHLIGPFGYNEEDGQARQVWELGHLWWESRTLG